MSYSQNNSRHPISFRQPRRNLSLVYQSLSRPFSPQGGRNEVAQNDQSQDHYDFDSQAKPELMQAVNRFMNKCCINQLYIILVSAPGFVGLNNEIIGGSYIGLLIALYVSHLIIEFAKALTQKEKVRSLYKFFEGAAISCCLSMFDSTETVFKYASVIFIPVSYLIKAILAYNCNRSVHVNFINKGNKTVLTIRGLIMIQLLIMFLQAFMPVSYNKQYDKSLSQYFVWLPLLGIILIILLFAVRLFGQIFFLYRSQIWNSNSSNRIKGALWIFGNIIALTVFLFFSYFRPPDLSREELDLGSILIFAIWCAISLVFSSHAREGVLEICCELVSILESNQEPIQEPNQYLEDDTYSFYISD